jgi:endonuclease YncB( thermonuclease family)
VAALAYIASPAAAAQLPACLPPVEGAAAKVASVQANGVLVLEHHRTARLESLLWPARDQDKAAAALSRQGVAAVRNLASGQTVVLRAAPPKLDRYGRLRVQAMLPDGKWLQRELLQRGSARASIAPDRRECARELYAAEAEARSAGAGLWALPAYAIRTPESLRWRDLGTFQIVEGKVVSVKVSGGRAYLDFGPNWRTDFTVTIAPEDMKVFRRDAVDPYAYSGKTVRVRGYIDRLHGFEIEATSPESIELL